MRRPARALLPLLLVAAALGAQPRPAVVRAEALHRHRNLGKAFYENPVMGRQAVEELRRALELAPGSAGDRLNYGLALLRAGREEEGIRELLAVQRQDPSLPHTWWNLGIAYERLGRREEARAQLAGMLERVPDDAPTHYNLGVLWQIAGDEARALRHLETAARLDPDMAAPQYQLSFAYRRAGRGEEAARALARFRELKRAQEGAAVPEDPQWSRWSELVDPVEPRGGPGVAPVSPVPLAFAAREVALPDAPAALASHGLAVVDAGGDGTPDLLAWSMGRLHLLAGGSTLVAGSGLERLHGVMAVAPGDADDDGRPDLCVVTAAEARLLGDREGRFVELPARLPAGRFRAAVWLDFDHDHDLDLALVGDRAALARNHGDGTWSDQTARFPFVAGLALGATTIDAVADGMGFDLAVSYADRPGVLYRDRLGGRYEAVPLAGLPAGSRDLAAFDVDGDGWTDLVATTSSGAPLVLRNLGREGALEAGFERLAAPASARAPFLFADLQNRAVADLVAADRVHLSTGLGAFAAAGGTLAAAGQGGAVAGLAASDFDLDGRVDLALLQGRRVRLLRNEARAPGRWLRVSLSGVKSRKLAEGAEVEVKAGPSYQKRRYDGAPLHFGLGGREVADAVRITWPNGLIQNETAQPAGRAAAIREAQRLSGSCPMIFTWDGERFRFLTDVLGVAPLGASAGDGEYFPVDHDEHVVVPDGALAKVDGRYLLRVTEELREVTYLDQLQLLAIDHPADVEVLPNDKFQGPPYPPLRLHGVRERIRPVRAVDSRGADVRERLLARDRRYPDAFARDFAGRAETHHLELDFGEAAADGRALLVLSGWVDWADGSTFLAAAQGEGRALMLPELQVRDASGQWRTVLPDMGIPAGKPKTIAVDLTGKWLSPSREVRIVTNLCVYWDEIFLAPGGEPGEVRTTALAPVVAELRFRGFSVPAVHPQRRQPETFDYHRLLDDAPWSQTPGLYTRLGEVRELLADVDDRMVVMGSGDELAIELDAAALPPLPPGWRRTLLLRVDGWAKDGDPNTAHSQSVEPLPFHGMSQYPYGAGERFPDSAAHREWRERSLTRPALRLVRPLRAGRGTPIGAPTGGAVPAPRE